MTDPRRRIPSLERLLEADAFAELRDAHGREALAGALRAAADDVRRELAGGDAPLDVEDPAVWVQRVGAILRRRSRPSLRPVVNATGVVLHTNLGRAPLADAARRAMEVVGAGYSNLEFDVEAGARGSRYVHCASLVGELTGAEAALVVNNNAAALVLAVNTFARGRSVLVSRGELVEIGGGFRIPDMLERAGARMVAVGTTNRTRPADYRTAATDGPPGMILKVHRSNFRMTGFTEEASLGELRDLADDLGVPLVHDLGSGLLRDAGELGLPAEPTPGASLAEGAHLVAFSGDKLLGGPQAGILAGREDLVESLKGNPLCRALRVDKATLAALEATLRLHRTPGAALAGIPALAMLARAPDEIESRARAMADRLSDLPVDARAEPVTSVVGGGTFPGAGLPSWAVTLGAGEEAGGADGLAAALRAGEPPVVGRIEEGRVVLDLRTVAPAEEEILVRRILEVAEGTSGG